MCTKIYTNTGNHVVHGSLLSDTVITKIATTVVVRLADFGNKLCRKLRNFPTHCCARNDKFECYFGVLESNAHLDFEGDIWLKKVRIIFA